MELSTMWKTASKILRLDRVITYNLLKIAFDSYITVRSKILNSNISKSHEEHLFVYFTCQERKSWQNQRLHLPMIMLFLWLNICSLFLKFYSKAGSMIQSNDEVYINRYENNEIIFVCFMVHVHMLIIVAKESRNICNG